MMSKVLKIMVCSLISFILLTACGSSKTTDKAEGTGTQPNKALQTYENSRFDFQVSYPGSWKAEEASPNTGIHIYINSDKNNKIYFYGQNGPINIPIEGFEESLIITNDERSGTLLTRTDNGKVELHFIHDNHFYGASAILDVKVYEENKEKIFDMIKSMKVPKE